MKITAYVCAIVDIIGELAEERNDHETGEIESYIYLALGSDIALWESLKALLLNAEVIRISNNRVSLTDKGREFYAKTKQIRQQEQGTS